MIIDVSAEIFTGIHACDNFFFSTDIVAGLPSLHNSPSLPHGTSKAGHKSSNNPSGKADRGCTIWRMLQSLRERLDTRGTLLVPNTQYTNY